VEKIHTYCGGIPQKGTPAYDAPLRYKLTWTLKGVIFELLGKATILKDGREIQVDKLEPEIVIFPEPVGETEAWYGLMYPKMLIKQLGLKDVKEAWDKTVRWPGWCETWKKLIGLHLTRSLNNASRIL
jgi:saccharopine dehydrogenase-like NADP-dependent oxidoreductase